MAQNQQKKHSSRKVGRNGKSPAHQRYNFERRWMKHKVARIARYVQKFPNWKLPDTVNDEVKTSVQVLLKKQKH